MFVTRGYEYEPRLESSMHNIDRDILCGKGQYSCPFLHCQTRQNASLAMLQSIFFYTKSYRCIGANDRIFDHFIFLSSDPTIPFNLVPIGSPALLIKTQALSSNLTTLPSGRCSFFTVRTTTACLMSPLRTLFAAEIDTPPPGPDSGPCKGLAEVRWRAY
jgi:hypothetical protein